MYSWSDLYCLFTCSCLCLLRSQKLNKLSPNRYPSPNWWSQIYIENGLDLPESISITNKNSVTYSHLWMLISSQLQRYISGSAQQSKRSYHMKWIRFNKIFGDCNALGCNEMGVKDSSSSEYNFLICSFCICFRFLCENFSCALILTLWKSQVTIKYRNYRENIWCVYECIKKKEKYQYSKSFSLHA